MKRDFFSRVTDADEMARLRRQGDVSLWLAIRELYPLPHVRVDMMASASRIGAHYAQGGQLDDLSRDTIFIKAGFRLGILQAAQAPDGSMQTTEPE